MHLFIACLSTETHSFSPVPTTLADFAAFYLRRGTATRDAPNLMTEALHLWRREAEALGWRVTESLSAIAEPAGPTSARTYASLRGEIARDLAACGAPDVILLQLHGAMIAEGEDDTEGDIAAMARAACPDAVIGVALDLHCHPSERLLSAADLVICFKAYPHDDAAARAAELFALARRALAGEIDPVMATFDPRMTALMLTTAEPMAGFVREMEAAEARPGILSVSLAHGFPWGDVARGGARMLVVADADPGLAAAEAERLGLGLYAIREAVAPRIPALPEALDRALAAPRGPVVLADMSDNPGAGAPGDATHVLRALLDRAVEDAALGLVFDPWVVRTCAGAGVGAELDVRLGGKVEALSGDPVDLRVRVMAVREGAGQHLGPSVEPMGTAVRLRGPGGLDIVVNDLRTQVYHPEAFTQLGIDLAAKRLVVVKSLFHFHAPFAAIASEIVLAAPPGRTRPDIPSIPLRARPRDFWPILADPLGDCGRPSESALNSSGAPLDAAPDQPWRRT